MIIRETGEDEFTIKVSRSEADKLKTALLFAAENDGRPVTYWSKFADDVAYVLHHELMPSIIHDCRCSLCSKRK